MKHFYIFLILLALPFYAYDQTLPAGHIDDNIKTLKSLDKMFLPFKLGMTTQQVENILYDGKYPKPWETMLVASEYGDTGVRYIWLYMKDILLPARILPTLDQCTGHGNVVFLFKDNILFQISFRVFHCNAAETRFVEFIQKIGATISATSDAIFSRNTLQGSIVISKGWGTDETWKYNINYKSFDAPRDKQRMW
jgi:hypothetical protein